MTDRWTKALALRDRARQIGRDWQDVARAAHNAGKLTREEREAAAMAGDFHIAYAAEQSGRDHLQKLRTQAQTELDAVVSEARGLIAAQADDARARLEKAAPTGVEAVAVRVEASDARSRVRSLLDQGRRPAQILAQAVEMGDRVMVNALRDERQWQDPNRFDPRPFEDAELALASGDEREALAELLQAERHGGALAYELGTLGLEQNAGLAAAIKTKQMWADAGRQFTLPDDTDDAPADGAEGGRPTDLGEAIANA